MRPTAPVCLLNYEAAEWLVCFVPAIQKQWWHRFLRSRLKHCFALKQNGDTWTLFEPWWSRILIATITNEEAKLFLTWGRRGVILRVKERIPGESSQLRGWMSCAALVGHLLGRHYFAYTPAQLFNRLIRESGVEVYDERK